MCIDFQLQDAVFIKKTNMAPNGHASLQNVAWHNKKPRKASAIKILMMNNHPKPLVDTADSPIPDNRVHKTTE